MGPLSCQMWFEEATLSLHPTTVVAAFLCCSFFLLRVACMGNLSALRLPAQKQQQQLELRSGSHQARAQQWVDKKGTPADFHLPRPRSFPVVPTSSLTMPDWCGLRPHHSGPGEGGAEARPPPLSPSGRAGAHLQLRTF